MSEFVQVLIILSFTIIALTAIVHGKDFKSKVNKRNDSIEAELSVTRDDIKRKK